MDMRVDKAADHAHGWEGRLMRGGGNEGEGGRAVREEGEGGRAKMRVRARFVG